MSERSITTREGRTWTFRERPDVRRAEATTHVILLVESGEETRVVSCLRANWESASLDLAGLLARSVPAGASRGVLPLEPPGGEGRF